MFRSIFILRFFSLLVILLFAFLFFQLVESSIPVFQLEGWKFIFSDYWSPGQERFGALSLIYGTIITSIIAIMIATPLSIGTALYITEVLPNKLSKTLALLVELIAAIPSVIFGFWGIFYLAPFVKDTLAPFLESYFGFLPIFRGTSYGVGLLTASIILSIMIIPTITSICREIFKTVSIRQKEGVYALGATKYEMIKVAVLPHSFSGIIGAVVLGLGRALGETMAVAMLIGNSNMISISLFGTGSTMASVIANEYAEAETPIHLKALTTVGLQLFIIIFIANSLARLIHWKYKEKKIRKKTKA